MDTKDEAMHDCRQPEGICAREGGIIGTFHKVSTVELSARDIEPCLHRPSIVIPTQYEGVH